MIPVNRLRNAIAAKVSRFDESSEHAEGQCDDDGASIEDVQFMQPYGLSAGIPTGSMGVLIPLGGQDDNSAMLCASPVDGTRPQTEAGETILYTSFGHKIHMRDDGSIEITTPDGGCVLTLNDDSSASLVFGDASIQISAAGQITVTPGTKIKLGGSGAALALARVTSTLTGSAGINAWAVLVEAFVNGLVPGYFTPPNNFAGLAGIPGGLGMVASGSPDADST